MFYMEKLNIYNLTIKLRHTQTYFLFTYNNNHNKLQLEQLLAIKHTNTKVK